MCANVQKRHRSGCSPQSPFSRGSDCSEFDLTSSQELPMNRSFTKTLNAAPADEDLVEQVHPWPRRSLVGPGVRGRCASARQRQRLWRVTDSTGEQGHCSICTGHIDVFSLVPCCQGFFGSQK